MREKIGFWARFCVDYAVWQHLLTSSFLILNLLLHKSFLSGDLIQLASYTMVHFPPTSATIGFHQITNILLLIIFIRSDSS